MRTGGYTRDDPRLDLIQPGNWYDITVTVINGDKPSTKKKKQLFLYDINKHGVFFFREAEVTKITTFRWPEILALMGRHDIQLRRW